MCLNNICVSVYLRIHANTHTQTQTQTYSVSGYSDRSFHAKSCY